MFELALFNQQVIKGQSSLIITVRNQLYDFCYSHHQKLVASLQNSQQRFRLSYALMFTAFEIQNDMDRSIKFFEQLDLSAKNIPLPWVSAGFEIDLNQVKHFGQQKIKEAQQINVQNQALKQMKQMEYDSLKTNVYVRQTCEKQTALFYLEKFYQHLVSLVSKSSSEAQIGVNFQLNDEKIKEQWD